MSEISTISFIPPLNINIRIQNRTTDGFNKRYQFVNPLGEKFELPKDCLKHNHKRFSCSLITRQDVLDLRAKLYQTTEKSEQNNFLSQYLIIQPPKRRYGSPDGARLFHVYYKIPKISGEVLFVCSKMFFAATGFTATRLKLLSEKIYKRQLLEQGDVDTTSNTFSTKKTEKNERLKKVLNAKKERILSLEQGTFEVFSKVIKSQFAHSDPEDDIPLSTRTKSDNLFRKSKKPLKKHKNEKNLMDCLDYGLIDAEKPEGTTKKKFIDLNAMEICRICLFNDGNLMSLFNKEKKFELTRVEMVSYSLSLEIKKDDGLPTKICRNCLEDLKIAYAIKKRCQESQELIQYSLEDAETYKPAEDSDTDYNSSECEKEEEKPTTKEPQIKLEITEESVPDHTEVHVPRKGPKKTGARFVDPSTCRPIKCYLCDCDFSTTPEDHFKTHHNVIQTTKCSKCEFETEFPWYLNLHYQIHADDKRLCMYCGNTYYTQPSYQSHLNHCKGRVKVRERLHCRFCSATYWNPHILREHERIHTNEKPYICDQCGSGFIRRIHLRKHMITAHNVEPAFRCINCSKGFLVKNRLLTHQSSCCRNKNFEYT